MKIIIPNIFDRIKVGISGGGVSKTLLKFDNQGKPVGDGQAIQTEAGQSIQTEGGQTIIAE